MTDSKDNDMRIEIMLFAYANTLAYNRICRKFNQFERTFMW